MFNSNIDVYHAFIYKSQGQPCVTVSFTYLQKNQREKPDLIQMWGNGLDLHYIKRLSIMELSWLFYLKQFHKKYVNLFKWSTEGFVFLYENSQGLLCVKFSTYGVNKGMVNWSKFPFFIRSFWFEIKTFNFLSQLDVLTPNWHLLWWILECTLYRNILNIFLNLPLYFLGKQSDSMIDI